LTLGDWVGSHRYLEPVARVRARIDAAVEAAAPPAIAPPDWDEYVEEFAEGVPLLHSQARIDLEQAAEAVVRALRSLAWEGAGSPIADDATVLVVEMEQYRVAPRDVGRWLLGDADWEPLQAGLLRSVGWITLAAALHPVVRAFAGWRDDDRWLRRYCPACGALPAMAQLVGSDPGRRRFMVCGRCASQWRYGRTGCPFCEAESHRLASVSVEGEAGLRIDYCESCRAYLKTYAGEGHELVLLADWTSLHLDVVARDRGLTRAATSLYDLKSTAADATPEFRRTSDRAEPSGPTTTTSAR
jgi:FdhE protein